MAQSKILFVDDEEQIRRLLSSFLGRRGYHVMTAIDGQEALQTARVRDADMVITDVNMPNIDGVELTRRLRADPRLRHCRSSCSRRRSRPTRSWPATPRARDEYVPKPDRDAGPGGQGGVTAAPRWSSRARPQATRRPRWRRSLHRAAGQAGDRVHARQGRRRHDHARRQRRRRAGDVGRAARDAARPRPGVW